MKKQILQHLHLLLHPEMQIYFSGTEQLTESLSKLNKNSGKTNPRCLVSGKGQAAFWQMPLILAGFSHWCSKESWRMNRNANLSSTHLSRKMGRRPGTWEILRARGSLSIQIYFVCRAPLPQFPSSGDANRWRNQFLCWNGSGLPILPALRLSSLW